MKHSAAAFTRLDWWARHRAVGTKHTTIPCFGGQQRLATCAFIKPLARVCGHGLCRYMSTFRARQCGLCGHVLLLRIQYLSPHFCVPDNRVRERLTLQLFLKLRTHIRHFWWTAKYRPSLLLCLQTPPPLAANQHRLTPKQCHQDAISRRSR